MIIDFHKRKTPMDPPVEHTISKDYAEKICNGNHLKTIDKFLSFCYMSKLIFLQLS